MDYNILCKEKKERDNIMLLNNTMIRVPERDIKGRDV